METVESSGKEYYRCKKCRRMVAAEENIVRHEAGKGQECFKWSKRSGGGAAEECSSVFVEPMKWVEEGEVQGRILCVGCKTRLGYFNWAGMQCNCGAWVTPAFQLHKARLDHCRLP